jgi:hypothetical protein
VFHRQVRAISGETREACTGGASATKSPEYRAKFISSVTWGAHREIESQPDLRMLAPYTATGAMGAVSHQTISEEL